MNKWQVIEDENLADIKIEVFGKTKNELVKNIIYSFVDTLVDIKKLKPSNSKTIKINSGNFKEMIFELVNKLIILKDVDFFLGLPQKISLTKNLLQVNLLGQKISNISQKTDIKALTHHKFGVKKKGNLWHAVLVFDI